MDFKQIQELVKLVNKSNIGELKIEKDNFKITIRQKNAW
jgi:acetyl-CoA carboxylase biotin carboxyl carrier protein